MANANEVKSQCEKSVKFLSGPSEGSVNKHHPTQKYNRKEVQKRLVIETWMDEQLRSLYDCDSDLDSYPEMDLDDILRLEETYRQEYIEKNLQKAEHPVNEFVLELLSRILDLKPIS